MNSTKLHSEENAQLLTSDVLSVHFSSLQQWVVIGSYEPGTMIGCGSSGEKDRGTSLVVQRLRFCPPKAEGPGLIPDQGTDRAYHNENPAHGNKDPPRHK